MHILFGILLIALLGAYYLIKALLTAMGVIRPPPIIPSGVAIGEQATRTLNRDGAEAARHQNALDKMTTLVDYNGEVWRVVDCKPAIDNTYKFLLVRVA